VRAIVIDPKVLIFDDAQAVDTCTEEEILARLKASCGSEPRSVFLTGFPPYVMQITSSYSTRGAIVEEFTHDALVRLNGLYAELHRKQFLEEELAAS
jgi:ABC-type multidrug transport system fused ATPase/permease subunit